jgi:hypothetical protein
VAELCAAFELELDEMVEELLGRWPELPEWAPSARPELEEPVRRLTRESIRAELAALRHGRLPESLSEADAEFAREAARLGAPVTTLSFGFRGGHAVQWRHWFELVERSEADPGRRRELLEHGSAFFFAYADRMVQMVSDEYSRERERLLRSSEQRRVHLVRELLDGAQIDGSALDYDLAAWHVGLVAWGPGAAEAARVLASRSERRLLLVGVVEDTFWGWLGSRGDPDQRDSRALAHALPAGAARLALGSAHRGPAGFRRSHREARDAHRVALGGADPVTCYEDVALVVLASRDEDAARAFVTGELRGLDRQDTRARRLRETLAAYYDCAQNAAATATLLGVHQQTVANRLRTIESLTGRSVTARHAELATALRLRRLLDLHSAA